MLRELHGIAILGNGGWQEPAALVIVAITAGVFLWARRRRQRASGGCGGGCGCTPERPPSGGAEPIRFTQRKADPPADSR